MEGMRKRRASKPQPGCMGKMVKLFDMDNSVPKNMLIADKPHGSAFSSYPVDMVTPSKEDELMSSEMRKSSKKTPMKMLLDQELSKEADTTYTPPNLVARLMGLDTLPQRPLDTSARRLNLKDHTCTMVESGEALQSWSEYPEEFVASGFHVHGINGDDRDEADMSFISQKFVEAGHFLTTEDPEGSEESEDAMEMLRSNKDLFLKFLLQPNSLVTRHLNEMATQPPSGTKRITVLKPSKATDGNTFYGKKTEKWVTKPTSVSHTHVLNKANKGGFPVSFNWKADDDPQPTRIVVLKPSLEKVRHSEDGYSSASLSPRTPHDENYFLEEENRDAQESRDIAREITNQMRENLGSLQMDESVLSSVLSSGYNGDESSFDKSENEYAAGSDSEVMSPTSRYSWSYINQLASPLCSSSVSREPHTRESSVNREAKKRLSRRWKSMTLNGNYQEQRHVRSRSSNTLGEMLSLFESKKSLKYPDDWHKKEKTTGSTSYDQNLEKGENTDHSPRNLTRSKSVPLSSDGNYEWVENEVGGTNTGKTPEELPKNNNLKLSFKGKVSSLFFSRNRKADNSIASLHKGGSLTSCSKIQQGQRIDEMAEGTGPHEVLSVTKPVTTGDITETQDQPSPISVLEPLFADDSISTDSSGLLNSEHPVTKTPNSKTGSTMIGKSPPIESIARTLCWKDSLLDTASTCPFNLSLVCSGPEEEQDWYILVQTLLATGRLGNDNQFEACRDRWHAPHIPLDPLLRDKYANTNKKFMQEAKQQQWRSNRLLIFDSVDVALKDIMTEHSESPVPVTVDQVWATMSQWISDEVRCVSGDNVEVSYCNPAIERVVRREVAGKKWVDNVHMEVNNVGRDIEQRLLDELLGDAVLQLTTRHLQPQLNGKSGWLNKTGRRD